MPAKVRHHAFSVAAIVALLGAAGILAFLVIGSHVETQPAPGLVHNTEIKIAPEASGRLAAFAVKAGQVVRKGDELVELSNPELRAALQLAKAQLDGARAARDRVYAGVRQEQVSALEQQIETAKADLVYAQQEFDRTAKLHADGFASQQDLDKATAAVANAQAQVIAAGKAYEAAHVGPIKEELTLADAKVNAAAAAVAVVEARVAKLRIDAPADGTITHLVAEPGEAIIPGQPVLTLEAAEKPWVSFNLREDQLGDLRLGSRVSLDAAGRGERIEARVTEIVPRGEFATWRAARVVGDHDLNTFLVRVDPVTAPSARLTPGMTTWVKP
jgi:HlyD family secretion protein